jgi:DNA polymerase III subunit alpha
MTKPKRFVGLHAHTQRSMYDGFGGADEHLQFAVDNGLDAMAITDHGNMNAFPEAEQKAKDLKKAGRAMKYIPGVEAYYHPDLKEWGEAKAAADQKRKEEREAAQSKRPATDDGDDPGVAVEDEDASKRIDKFLDPVNRRHHLVLLPKSRKGLENIFRMVSRSNREGYYRFPRIDARMLKEHGEDVVVSTACVAGVPSWATYAQFPGKTFDELTPDLLDQPGARESVMRAVGNEFDRLCDAVGAENVFAEIQFNKLAPQHLTNRVLIEFAKSNGMKLVAAADSHYCSPDLWRAREVYKLLGRMGRKDMEISPDSIPSDVKQLKCELYPKNAEQMWDSYKEYCSGYDFYDDNVVFESIENAWHVAHDVIGDVSIDTSMKLPSFGVRPGLTPFQTLVELCKEGMRHRQLAHKPEYVSRLKNELNVIKKLENAIYFLTLKSVLDVARRETLIGCGRGSGAGSLVNYVLGITDVDPVTNKLIFARFMSLARSKNDYPDIDVDVSDRDKVIDMLKEEFGEKTIVPISNFNGLQMKSLVKDVSKLHGVPFDEVNAATIGLDGEVKPHIHTGDETKGAVQLTYDACMEHSPKFRALMEKYPAVDNDVKIIGKQPKAVGKHAGGIIVHDDPDGVMPLISVRGDIQTPWTEGMAMKGLSPYGLIKYDLLGLDTLRIIERCVRRILKRHHGVRNPTHAQVQKWYDENLTPSRIDPADEQVFDHVFRGSRFAGIFQFTNPSTQRFITDLDPRSVHDLAAATAIYRPGPLAANVDKLYIKAKRTGDKKDYGHPAIAEVLDETMGFVIYQEQLQELAMKLSGFSEDDADRIRKAILKRTTKDSGKGKSLTDELHEKFIAGAVANGYPEAKAEALYEDVRAFAAYGFNRAHSYSYGYISYQCAWLMTYFEPEWLCSYVESMLGDPDSRRRALSEIKSMGYEVAKVDINHSTKEWEIGPDGRTFIPSFLTVKGMGVSAINEILVHRPYRKLEDLLWHDDTSWKHSKFNAKALDALIRVGAFDSMKLVGPDRTFETYRQLHHVLIDGQAELKKRLKTDPTRHIRRLAEMVEEAKTLPDWNREAIVKAQVELFGSIDADTLLDDEIKEQLRQHDVPPIEQCDSPKYATYWMVLAGGVKKTARTGNNFFQLSVYGSDGSTHRMFVWGTGSAGLDSLKKYACYIVRVKKDKLGFSTNLRDMREVGGE